VGRTPAQEASVAKRGKSTDYKGKKVAVEGRKQKRQEQKRQDEKARKAGKAERAAEA
jgi:hypothetical protein